MRLPKFDYFSPRTLQEAVSLLAEKGDTAHVMAGGTDVIVKMNHGRLAPKAIVAIGEIEGLDRIHFDAKEGLTIGAMARLVDVASNPDVLSHYPAVSEAILCMANVEIRNMATVAGNLCNAAPSADSAPPLMTLGAEVVLAGAKGERRLPLDQFFRGPSLTNMEHGEILTSILVPCPPPGSGAAYKRISGRCGVDIAAVGVSAMGIFNGKTCTKAGIVLGAVAPVPLRAVKTEALLQGCEWTPEVIEKAGLMASEEARPISDVRASAEWRKQMVAVLTRRAIQEALERARKR